MVDLIIETGTGSPVSNSYVSVEDAKQYALNRGVTLKGDDNAIKSSLILATEFMECISRFKGSKTHADQALHFPRKGLANEDGRLPDDVIPVAIKNAQMQLVVDSAVSGKPLVGNVPQYALKRRTLGPLTQEWATGSGTVQTPVDPHTRFWAYIADYLRGGIGNGGVIR